MTEVIDVVALLVIGPLVGVEFAVAAFANPAFARLGDEAFGAARSDASRVLGKWMPFWYSAAVALLIGAAVSAADGPQRWLVAVAAGVMGAVVLATVTVMVPINNRIAGWTGTGELSRPLAARWDRLHWLRVALLAVMFLLLTVAVA